MQTRVYTPCPTGFQCFRRAESQVGQGVSSIARALPLYPATPFRGNCAVHENVCTKKQITFSVAVYSGRYLLSCRVTYQRREAGLRLRVPQTASVRVQ
jgi:hypothetical protein